MTRILRILLFALGAVFVLVALVVLGINLPPGRRLVADTLAGILSAPGRTLAIGRLDGALPLHLKPRDITVSDATGAWMHVDRMNITWRPQALLGGTLTFGEIAADLVEVVRKPVIPPAKSSGGGLAFGIDIQKLALTKIDLKPAVLGTAATLAVDGKVRLVNPVDGLMVDLAVRRTDGATGQALAHIAYVPATGRVTVSARANEPGGGLAARALALPGLPPVHLEAMARGTLDDLQGTLTFAAGNAAKLEAQLTVARDAAGRRFTLAANGHGEALIPEAFRAAAAGQIKLAASGSLGAGGIVHFDRIALRAPALTATAHGTVDAGGDATDLSIQAEVPRNPALSSLLPMAANWGGVSVNGHVASAKAGGQGAYDFEVDARAKGLTLGDPQLATLVGPTPALAASGTADPRAGRATFTALSLDVAAGGLGFAGTVDRRHVAGTITASRANLALLGKLAGRPLAGTADLDARVDASFGAANGPVVNAQIHQLAFAEFHSGIRQADAVLGATPTLSGTVRLRGKVVSLSNAKLTGAHASLNVSGTVADDIELAATGNLDDLAVLNPKLSGPAYVHLSVAGTLAAPTAKLNIAVPKAVAFGQPVQGLAMTVAATHLRTAPAAELAVEGKVAGQQVALSATAGRSGAGAWTLGKLDGHALGVTVSGSGSLGQGGQHAAAIHLAAPDLGSLDAFAGQPLKGAATLDLTLPAGSDALRVDGTVTKLAAAGASVPKATIAGAVTGLFVGKPAFKGTVDAPGAAVKGTALGALKLTVAADTAGAEIGVGASPRGIPLDAAAKIAFAPALSITVSKLSAGKGGEALALTKPLAVTRGTGGAFSLSGVTVKAGSGTLRLDGKVGATLDLTAKLDRVPLALADLAAPSLGASGTLSGTAHITGPASAPNGSFKLAATGVSTRQIRAAPGVGAIALAASGTLTGGAVKLDAKISGGAGVAANVAGTIALAKAGALNLTVKGRLNAALANPMLSGESRLGGTVNLDTRVTGTVAAPKLGGSAELAGGSYTDPAVGVKLSAMTAHLAGSTDAITISSFSAKIGGGGGVTGHGRIGLAPGAGYPGDIQLKFDNAAVANGIVTATFGGDLALSGPLARAPKISGTVRIHQASVEIANRLPGSVKTLDVRHVHAPPAVRAQVARLKKSEGAAGGPVFDAALDIKLVAESQIFVRGRGIDAELGGTLRLEGHSAAPQVVGAFTMRRGTFDVLGKRLDFSQSSKLIFDGTLDPQLDLEAESQSTDVTAKIVIGGRASAPKLTLTSEPQLPQDEVAARLLFGKSADKLSAGQAATLALSVAELSGFGGGQGILDKVRRSFGLDQLSVTQDASGGTAVGVSRYVTKNISIGAQQSTKGSTKATVNLDITPHIRASAGAGADGSGDVGINMQWDY